MGCIAKSESIREQIRDMGMETENCEICEQNLKSEHKLDDLEVCEFCFERAKEKTDVIRCENCENMAGFGDCDEC